MRREQRQEPQLGAGQAGRASPTLGDGICLVPQFVRGRGQRFEPGGSLENAVDLVEQLLERAAVSKGDEAVPELDSRLDGKPGDREGQLGKQRLRSVQAGPCLVPPAAVEKHLGGRGLLECARRRILDV